MKKTFNYIAILLAGSVLTFFSCQDLERPALGSFPKDANAPGGPLKFFAAFDGTTTNVFLNAVDSIRANFPATNPMKSIDGISGKAIQGDGTQFITYPSANDFGGLVSSFTVSFWEKRNGIPGKEAAFAFSLPSSAGHWSSTTMFVLFDWSDGGKWTPTSDGAVKFMVYDNTTQTDNFFEWVGSQRVPGVQDNNWHHMAFVYDATTSNMILYVDGVANGNVKSWGSHGGVNLDASKISQLSVGGDKAVKDRGWGQHWDGGLDQFRMYATALKAAEVQALFAGKK
jgi:Concanavalin A-like lectin/glucanases superfamily